MAGSLEDHTISTELSRELNLFHLTMMGVGMMIGAGVFLGVGNAIRVAGPGGVLLTFALNGMVAMFTAMSYAELSSAIPRAGGAYNFARVAFGKGTSFIAGWMEWFASSVAGSLYAVTFAIYTMHYFNQLNLLAWLPIDIFYGEKILAVLVAILFVYINYRGASETGKTGAFFTLGQMITLGIIGAAGIWVFIQDPSRLHNFQPFLPMGWGKLLITMGFTYVAFEGYEVIAQAGDEAIEPKRNLPKAMLYSIFAVTVTYLVVAFAAVVGVKAGSPGVDGPVWEWIGGFKEKGFGMAVQRLMPFGGFLVTLTVIFASTSALNATIYSATRASYALGRDRMLPKMFAKISLKNRTPFIALFGTAVIVLFVAGLLPTMDVASSASMMFLLLFFLVNLCVIKVRRNMGDELNYGYLMPFFPLLPILAILIQATLALWMHQMSPVAWIIAPAWIGGGALIYLLYAKSRSVTTSYEIVTLEEEKAEEVSKNRVLIPVANPNNALQLVRNGFKILEAKQAQVELLTMVKVPEQLPLSHAEDYMWEGREAITEAMIYLTTYFPVTTTIRYCRNVARGIVSAAREKKIDTIILGWKGKTARTDYIFGSTIDPVIQNAPSNVLVFKNCNETTYKRILVPVSGGPNSRLALAIAAIMVDPADGYIVPLNITAPGKETLDIEQFIEKECEKGVRDKVKEPQYAVSKQVSATILEQAAHYDLIVIGASNAKALSHLIRSSIPEEVAASTDKPMVMVKSTEGIQSFLKRYL
ncbi:amino acid permease [candidate division KSB1 bacterium]|nr:amino acid permease [candidate division KSB1 bacterium]RQW02394.1 MAG: amino acid permease [candidate division KSB1 bacterium]